MKKVGQLLGIPGEHVYDGSVHYDRKIHHNDKVGVEFEVEGTDKFSYKDEDALHRWWNIHDDGSLRGRAVELVMRRPYGGADAEAALGVLRGRMDKCSFSYRTSVHVHLDVRDITSTALYRILLLYLVFEELLFDVCGKKRAANNFCLSSYNGNGFLAQLSAISPTQCIRSITSTNTADLRYASLNLDAVRKFGSLEFRGHEGTHDVDRIATWINILTHIKHYAVRTRNVEDLLTKVSDDGPRIILAECFSPELAEVLQSGGDTFGKLLRGARRAQQVIIDRDLQHVNAELMNTMVGVAPPKKPQQLDVGGFRFSNTIRQRGDQLEVGQLEVGQVDVGIAGAEMLDREEVPVPWRQNEMIEELGRRLNTNRGGR